MKKHIPNTLTLLNLLCGSIATIYAVEGLFGITAFFVFLGIFFDFFDGFAARKLRVQSEIGLQLDSLADMVTSGVVPGIVMYQLLKMSLNTTWGEVPVIDINIHDTYFVIAYESFIPFIGLLIPLASAYRLAKFNIDDDQQTSFTGLPTPANALFILSLPLVLIYQDSDMAFAIIRNTWVLIAITLASCYMLNANIKLFALKFKNWGLRENAVKYVFLILCALLLAMLRFAAIPLIIILYVIISLITNKRSSLVN
ncbi:CDP-alcohol phosphatidyltransferase family protein [Sinomicrobium weinanense]|uniref:CDP-alcohol phosphatidyltransferase family protein n=1 Tax=Sinomicrobium weinanense TaxID=2842200 RepID=A0A926JS37_9FLAO|nr:CDP-alcohol phosphatidyltransferase family protein [Sinomicrobium weinanense]MBC9796289.1 CDP-alcohol phosphatidyltransferase family protein [Sinomicrobium weinanense]MBU3123230.1 CDP-alcohol phosphatidyltransferase family protein [Sinomicrobium weinanense]